MNDPLPVIRMHTVEFYGKLTHYNFTPAGRTYHNQSIIIIDTITSKRVELRDLPVFVCCAAALVSSHTEPLLIITHASKINNRKERHEVIGTNATLLMRGRVYTIDRIFFRTELIKRVPERTVIPLRVHPPQTDTRSSQTSYATASSTVRAPE